MQMRRRRRWCGLLSAATLQSVPGSFSHLHSPFQPPCHTSGSLVVDPSDLNADAKATALVRPSFSRDSAKRTRLFFASAFPFSAALPYQWIACCRSFRSECRCEGDGAGAAFFQPRLCKAYQALFRICIPLFSRLAIPVDRLL